MTTKAIEAKDEVLIKAMQDYSGPMVSTMGPGGTNVATNIHHGGAFIGASATQDGVTLAKNMRLVGTPEERYVSHLMDESAERQLESVGDGTTSTLVLCMNLFKMFVEVKKRKSVRFAKVLFSRIEKNIHRLWKEQVYDAWLDPGSNDPAASNDAKSQYNLHSKTIAGVAKVATHGDESLTNLLVKAALHVGPSGHIEVQRPGQGDSRHQKEDALELGQGMVLKSRLAFRQFANSGFSKRMSFIAEEGCLWLISNTPIQKGAEIAKACQAYNEYSGKVGGKLLPLIIVAPEFSQDAVNVAGLNSAQKHGRAPDGRMNGIMICLISTMDHYTEQESIDVIEDLAAVTGAPVFGTKTDRRITQAHMNVKSGNPVFGESQGLVSVSYDGTTIRFTEEESGKVDEIGTGLILRGEAEFDDGIGELAKIYIARGKRILGQTAKIILKSGPHSVQNARYDLADDAVRTLTSACRSGVVRGQGVGLYLLGVSLIMELEEKYGYDRQMLLEVIPPAFHAVREQVLLNMEVNEDSSVYDQVLNNLDLKSDDLNDIVAFDESGDGYTAINAKDNFIYDGADTAITALEISLQTSKQLGTTKWIMDVYQ